MSVSFNRAETFFNAHDRVVLIEVEQAKGSTPRQEDAFMLIDTIDAIGTIGGGQLEYMAIAHARKILQGDGEHKLTLALGPALNQCCGGHVSLNFKLLENNDRATLLERLKLNEDAQPWIYIFGAGHVGQALYRALFPLPFNVKIFDNRQDLPNQPKDIPVENLALPESAIQDAPKGTSFIIMSHDHALDFILTEEALKRKDSPYIGMIGSKTKRVLFDKQTAHEDLSKLTSPMAKGTGNQGKQPEIIAALIAAELIAVLT
jgi:xanthine dehydrogenase accessory factor